MAIKWDATGTGDDTGVAADNTLSWMHTMDIGNIILIAVGLKTALVSPAVTGVTFDGNACSLLRRDNGVGYGIEMWYYTGLMPVGPAPVVVTFGGSYQGVGNSVSYSGVNAGDPFDVDEMAKGVFVEMRLPLDTTIDNTFLVAHCWVVGDDIPRADGHLASRWDEIDSYPDSDQRIAQNGCDSKLPQPRGVFNFTWTTTGAVIWYAQGVALKPLLVPGEGMGPGRAGGSIGVRM